MSRKHRLARLCLFAVLSASAGNAAADGEPSDHAAERGRFAIRATVGTAEVTRSGYDRGAVLGATGLFAANDYATLTVGVRHFPKFATGSGNSRGQVQVTMNHIGGEIGIPIGIAKPFLRPELTYWEASAEYQGRELDSETDVGFGFYAGVNVRLHRRLDLGIEGGRSFDVSGTDIDSLALNLTVHF